MVTGGLLIYWALGAGSLDITSGNPKAPATGGATPPSRGLATGGSNPPPVSA